MYQLSTECKHVNKSTWTTKNRNPAARNPSPLEQPLTNATHKVSPQWEHHKTMAMCHPYPRPTRSNRSNFPMWRRVTIVFLKNLRVFYRWPSNTLISSKTLKIHFLKRLRKRWLRLISIWKCMGKRRMFSFMMWWRNF